MQHSGRRGPVHAPIRRLWGAVPKCNVLALRIKRVGQIAVIFLSVRTDDDHAAYAAAATAMDALAAEQPGYRGMDQFSFDVGYQSNRKVRAEVVVTVAPK